MSQDLFIPSSPVSFAERPLSKGIVRHVQTNAMEQGTVYDAKNFTVSLKGLNRRDGIFPFTREAVSDPPIQDVFAFWKLDGTQVLMGLGSKFLWLLTQNAATAQYWTSDTGTISSVGTAVTGSGAQTWQTDAIRAGDVLVTQPGDPAEASYIVASIGSETTLTLVAAPAADFTDVAYEIRRVFQHQVPYYVDWVNNGERLLFADGGRGLYSYDGLNFEGLMRAGTAPEFFPGCVTYFNDRIFVGRTFESSEIRRDRIRWSGIGFANHNSFDAVAVLDLPYSRGELLRLVPLGNMLIAYFTDAVYIGHATNNPNLPVQFQRLEGNVGLAGQRAVMPWQDGHFFLGPDDAYFLSNQGLQRIGMPVQSMIISTPHLWMSQVTTDLEKNQVVFAISQDGTVLDRFFTMNYLSQAWAYTGTYADAVAGIALVISLAWTDLTDGAGILSEDTWAGFGSEWPTWSTLGTFEIPQPELYYAYEALVHRRVVNTEEDATGVIPVVLETRDFDFDEPDHDKVWTKLSVKFEEPSLVNVDFITQGSTNRGRTWKTLGTLRVPEGYDEGRLDFRLTGDMARFRLTSSANTTGYTVVEMVLRVKIAGMEAQSRGPSA